MQSTVRPFAPQDLEGFLFRPEEETEARLGGHDNAAAFVASAADECLVYTALGHDGLPYLFFARSPCEDDPGSAFVWMLGHRERMYRNKVTLLRSIPAVLAKWHETTPLLYTYMNPASKAHVRILRALGFVAIRVVGYANDPNNPYFEMVRIPHGN